MVVLTIPEGATNVIPYEVTGNNLDLNDGEIIVNLKKKERDDAVHLDFCWDYLGGLVMGTIGAMRYAAQVDIPPRAYTEEEAPESEEGGTKLVPVPFDINRCTLTLWEVEE